jgi:hypothetical protein
LYSRYENPRFTTFGETEVKYSTTHYLGINFSRRLQIGLYDNIIWLKNDSSSQRGFDVQYLNPLVFLRPIEFTFGSLIMHSLVLLVNINYTRTGFYMGKLVLMILILHTQSIIIHKVMAINMRYSLVYGIRISLFKTFRGGLNGMG